MTKYTADFDAWVETLPDKHWAKYDIAACRLGWDAYAKRIKADESKKGRIDRTCCLPSGAW